jgi:hypothetical protein
MGVGGPRKARRRLCAGLQARPQAMAQPRRVSPLAGVARLQRHSACACSALKKRHPLSRQNCISSRACVRALAHMHAHALVAVGATVACHGVAPCGRSPCGLAPRRGQHQSASGSTLRGFRLFFFCLVLGPGRLAGKPLPFARREKNRVLRWLAGGSRRTTCRVKRVRLARSTGCIPAPHMRPTSVAACAPGPGLSWDPRSLAGGASSIEPGAETGRGVTLRHRVKKNADVETEAET